MEREEYFRRLSAAYEAMDDRARALQLRLFERSAADYPRESEAVTPKLAQIVPFRRAVGH